MKLLTYPLLAIASLAAPQDPVKTAVIAPVAAPASRPIDLVLCLDTSGSMNGLIDAARQNLWAVVNDLATLQPAPHLRVALLTFGSPEYAADTGYVAIQTGLTEDLDTVSEKLFALTTSGGAEYVARVIKRSLDDLQWSPDADALKLLFVAGNESAMQDPMFSAPEMGAAAIGQGVLVNTIFCGDPTDSAAADWRTVALRADGKFAAIQQNAARVIESPFDAQIAELSRSLNSTYVPYGVDRQVWVANQAAQDGNAERLNVVAAAQRAQTKASSLYGNSRWDLVDASRNEDFDITEIKKSELPEALRKLTVDELRAHVATQAKRRAGIQQQVQDLSRQRRAWVADELQKQSPGERLFEEAVLESVREQAEARGFVKPEEPAQENIDPRFVEVVKDAAQGYGGFVRVTGQPHVAPEMCRIPGPFVRPSEASREHGGKLYLLYARFAEDSEYLREGIAARVGQTLVKESWERVAGPQTGPTEASKRYPLGLTLAEGEQGYHAGDSYGLFVMHKLAVETEGTDQGWVYGTIDKQGKVTGAGRMASCIKCHEDAENDRRFGLR